MDDILQDSPRDPAAYIFQDRQSGQLVVFGLITSSGPESLVPDIKIILSGLVQIG